VHAEGAETSASPSSASELSPVDREESKEKKPEDAPQNENNPNNVQQNEKNDSSEKILKNEGATNESFTKEGSAQEVSPQKVTVSKNNQLNAQSYLRRANFSPRNPQTSLEAPQDDCPLTCAQLISSELSVAADPWASSLCKKALESCIALAALKFRVKTATFQPEGLGRKTTIKWQELIKAYTSSSYKKRCVCLAARSAFKNEGFRNSIRSPSASSDPIFE